MPTSAPLPSPPAGVLYPKPDARGLAELRRLVLNRTGREISEADAHEVLSRAMRHLYLLNFPECDTHSTPESPTTTDR